MNFTLINLEKILRTFVVDNDVNKAHQKFSEF